MEKDIIVEDFTPYLSTCNLPIITIYDIITTDYKGSYVARLSDIGAGQVHMKYIVYVNKELDEVRKRIPQHMVRIMRSKEDHPCIIESYM